MPIRHTSWQRRDAQAESVTVQPAPAGAPTGLKRLLYAEPAGGVIWLVAGMLGLILLLHSVAWLTGVHVAWLWGGLAAFALAAFALDWPDAARGALTAPAMRRAALTSRMAIFSAVGALLSFVAF